MLEIMIVYAHGRRLCSNWVRHGSNVVRNITTRCMYEEIDRTCNSEQVRALTNLGCPQTNME